MSTTPTPAPTLVLRDTGWWVCNVIDGTGRLVNVGPFDAKGHATAFYLRVVGLLPPAPRPVPARDDRP